MHSMKQAMHINCRRLLRSLSNASNPQTKIEKLVRDSIKATGPMQVSTYMQFCLSHPTHGYYMNPKNPVFGKQGDFITSPEISQIFGELIAIWYLSRWYAAGQPPRIRVIELGPGRGVLAADVLRTWQQFPAAYNALFNGGSLHLVETSAAMKDLQASALEPFGDKGKDFIKWHDSLGEVDDVEPNTKGTFTIILAHEFFDALPINIIERGEDLGWHELLVTDTPSPEPTSTKSPSSPDSTSKSTKASALPPLRLTKSREPSPYSNLLGSLSQRYLPLPAGTRVEVSLKSMQIAQKLAEMVNDPKGAGGSALVIDYGHDGISGNSLRAFKKHKIVDIFKTPGECDITANVDFALLKEEIARRATCHGSITQRDFLARMGIEARLEKLVGATSDAARKEGMISAAKRLVDSMGMGVQYRVLGVTGTGWRPLAEGEEDAWPFVKTRKAEGRVE